MAENWDAFIVSLYETMYDKLYRTAFRLTGNVETAKELTQDVFLLAMGRQETVLNHPQPEAWLMVSLVNLARNERRRHSHQDLSLEDVFEVSAPPEPSSLDEMLPFSLSDEDRKLLVWRFEEQLSHREMAERLAISETACRSRLSRTIAKCRKLLEDRSHEN